MKSILMSIQPKYCELIASGKKTIEVRKTVPKVQTPFKVYIYCTQGNGSLNDTLMSNDRCQVLNGKVIGEFVCRGIMCPSDSLKLMAKQSCLSEEELHKYSGGKTLYGLRISDLKIYDKPKELDEFYKYGKKKACKYGDRTCFRLQVTEFCRHCEYQLKRPPQSWRYVEEL